LNLGNDARDMAFILESRKVNPEIVRLLEAAGTF